MTAVARGHIYICYKQKTTRTLLGSDMGAASKPAAHSSPHATTGLMIVDRGRSPHDCIVLLDPCMLVTAAMAAEAISWHCYCNT